ncbi:MAG: BREX-3 system phosphatase PglZ [Blastocatellia bacterium]|nr:BREX-3 system phosphatase PglZ [Blastocatellia bacterium]
MANWRDAILTEFQPKISRLTLVADPDGLLTEEGMLSAIRERGFDLIQFDDSISFRFAYESQYRSQWDKGLKTDLVVLLRSAEQQLGALPFDLLKAGRQLTFALHQLFPKLNYPVISGLDRIYLDSIHDAYQRHDGGQLTERETREFVLMHCFGIAPKLIKTPIELLKILLSLHSRNVRLPDSLCEYLLESLSRDDGFNAWPLADMLRSREKFLQFLQNEWAIFVAGFGHGGQRARIPFDEDDIRAYIDTFFLDGLLSPVEKEEVGGMPAWARTGVVHDPKADALRRFGRLRQRFEAEIPGAENSHREWQQAAQRWAELVVLRWEWDESLGSDDRIAWIDLQEKVEQRFGEWMLRRYGSLHNLAYNQEPVMVHHIPRFMAVERVRRKLAKIALLVLDGLADDQWILLRKNLESRDQAWRFHESTAFAWVPTLTSVSRQAIFAGEPPLYFPDSLETTSKEKAHWLRFWEDQGVARTGVELITGIDDLADSRLESAMVNPRLSVLGLVWNKVDDIMHGMQMQTAGMHNQVSLWASQGHLQQLLVRLAEEGFVVYLTADHGNVTACGVGNPREGVLVETRGKRARVYDRPEFRDEVAAKFPDSIPWPNHGLPPTRQVLLARNLKAFADPGSEIVAHGGIALEEVIVPFVAITREGG